MALVLHSRSPDDRLGQQFADVHTLHEDSRFTVYEAREITTGRQVFVKLPADARQRWLRDALDDQAAILGAVSTHPHIITLYQRRELADGRPVLVLEHCARRLSDALHGGGRLEPREVARIGIKLAGALEVVHRAGIVHCDVRPSRVLLNAWDEPVLAGFDEAVRCRPGVASYSVLQSTTPHTAPELLLGDEVSERSDVYGLAATLFELLAGRTAFRTYIGESSSAVVLRMLNGQLEQIDNPDVPLAMSDLLRWAMATEPARRPPSPSWLAEELARVEIEQGWPRTPLVS